MVKLSQYHGPKNQPQRKPWRHPLKRGLKVPYRAAAAVAVMEMGITDYAEIARAVGLTVAEVKRIDSATEQPIRQLCTERIPYGEYFRLDRKVRCPKCNAWLIMAPCVACDGPSKCSER